MIMKPRIAQKADKSGLLPLWSLLDMVGYG